MAFVRSSSSPVRSGFTLLEMIVVVVIVALLATIAIPRFTGTTKRTFELTVDQVADLLTVFAQRDALGRQPVGLVYDPERRALSLVILAAPDENLDAPAEWRLDRATRPVKLPHVVDDRRLSVSADGEYVDIREWPLTHTPGEGRPRIRIGLESIDGAHSATLTLDGHGLSPKRQGERDAFAGRSSVDLDSQGRSREDW